MTARDMSNGFLVDQVRAKERMRALTATPHLIDDAQIEVLAYWVVLGVVWTVTLLVWVLA